MNSFKKCNKTLKSLPKIELRQEKKLKRKLKKQKLRLRQRLKHRLKPKQKRRLKLKQRRHSRQLKLIKHTKSDRDNIPQYLTDLTRLVKLNSRSKLNNQ